jgi:hypothetical protein
MKANQDALITKYDIYTTMRHLAVFPRNAENVPSWSKSLLDEIPKNRTCKVIASYNIFVN